MIRKTTQVKVAAAFKLLNKYGIGCVVAGMYDLDNAGEAVMYANDPETFYRHVGSDHMLKQFAQDKA